LHVLERRADHFNERGPIIDIHAPAFIKLALGGNRI